MRWFCNFALCSIALFAGIAAPSEATQPFSGRIANLRAAHDARTPVARYIPELNQGDTVPDFRLVDQRGRSFSLAQFRGRALVLSFVFTRCRDATMCSLVSAKFSRLQRMLARAPIHLLEVTLDPAYDTPTILARYGAAFGADAARWTLATGEASVVAELAARAGIVSSRTSRGVDHSEAVLILDPRGRLSQAIDGNRWTADDALTYARASLGTAPTPLASLWLWLESGVAAVCGRGSGMTTVTALSIFTAVLATATFVLRRLLSRRRT